MRACCADEGVATDSATTMAANSDRTRMDRDGWTDMMKIPWLERRMDERPHTAGDECSYAGHSPNIADARDRRRRCRAMRIGKESNVLGFPPSRERRLWDGDRK